MKKILFVLMVLLCALLFSCATNSGVSEEKIPGVNTGHKDIQEPLIAEALADDPVIGKWAAKYEFAQNPEFLGFPLITDNSAFGDIPDGLKARKLKAEALNEENRILDAWKAYGEDDNEYIIALKIMHAIDGYTDTIMHQGFVLSNLSPDQDLYEYREDPNQKGETILWDPVEVAEEYAEKNFGGVMPPILELALGCYYQSAAIAFEDEWIMPLDDAYETSASHFRNAIAAGVYNDYALFKAVDAFLSAGYFDEGLEIIHCLELGEPDYSFHFYQEARAYMCKGEYQNALPCAARAIINATIPDDVAAGAQVMADGFMYDSRDVDSAMTVLEASKPYMDEIWYYGPVFEALDILMFAKNRYPGASYDDQIIKTLDDAFAFIPDDSDYLYELVDYFYNYEYYDLGIRWIESILKEYDGDDLASGNLNFELGQFYMQFDEWQKALDCFNKAETQLKAAGAFNSSTSNIPYYQDVCREKLIGDKPVKNRI